MNMEYERDKYVYPGQRIEQNGMPNGHGQGLGVRDYFAAQALNGMLVTANAPILHGLNGEEIMTAQAAYKIADAMLAARIQESSND